MGCAALLCSHGWCFENLNSSPSHREHIIILLTSIKAESAQQLWCADIQAEPDELAGLCRRQTSGIPLLCMGTHKGILRNRVLANSCLQSFNPSITFQIYSSYFLSLATNLRWMTLIHASQSNISIYWYHPIHWVHRPYTELSDKLIFICLRGIVVVRSKDRI